MIIFYVSGDHNYKRNTDLELKEQMITSLPDIQTEALTAADEFLIVACDGIWNSLSSQECVDFVKERIERGDKISMICEDVSVRLNPYNKSLQNDH